MRIPGESAAYRAARTALLAEEIELRRHLARVAEQRRALPPGPEVTARYRFEGEEGEVDLAGLFAGKPTRVAYSYMFGPQRERPCPMCTNLLDAWEGNAADIGQQVSLVVIARSPLSKLLAWKRERAGVTCGSTATWTAPTPAIAAVWRRTGLRCQLRMSSPVVTESSACSGPRR